MKQIPATISKTPATCFSLKGFFLSMLSVMKVTATVRALAVMELNCSGYLPRRNPQKIEPTLLRARKSKNFHLFSIFHKLFRLKSVGSNSFSSVCVYFQMKGLVPPQKRLTRKNGKMSYSVNVSNIYHNLVIFNNFRQINNTNGKYSYRQILMKKTVICCIQSTYLYNIMKLTIFLVLLLFIAVQPRRRVGRSIGSASSRVRRANAYSAFGRGIAALMKNGYQDSDEGTMQSGRQMEAEVNKIKLHDEMLDDKGSFWSVLMISIVGVGGVLCFLRCRSRQENFDIDYQRIRQRRQQREKRDRVLDAMHEHGVHPDRANGNIYRIRL